jgi:15-cis-phytoene desaturase
MSANSDVIVVGAGLAGLTCALRLVQKGYKVTVFEKRAVLGGRTSSWNEDGMDIESGLHKVLGVYRAMPELLSDVGVSLNDIVNWVDAVEFHSPTDHPSSGYFTLAPLHRPLRTLRHALSSPYISWSERGRLMVFMISGILDFVRNPGGFDDISVVEYARRYGVEEKTLRKIMHPLTQGVFFIPPEEYSAYATFAPIVAGLKRGGTFRVGAFRGGMSDVLIAPIVRAIERHGGTISTETAITNLVIENEKVVGVESENMHHDADHVVLATPIGEAQRLLQLHFSEQQWAKDIIGMSTVSTISVQFDLPSPAFATDHTHFSNTELCCFAEQVHTTFRKTKGRLSCIVYPAEALLMRSDEEVIQTTREAAAKLGIQLEGAIRARVVRHSKEFYGMHPGAEALRPLGSTPVPGLTLAGDYMKQPFLASMEGAIISGNRAAQIVESV